MFWYVCLLSTHSHHAPVCHLVPVQVVHGADELAQEVAGLKLTHVQAATRQGTLPALTDTMRQCTTCAHRYSKGSRYSRIRGMQALL
jgi:hypothetical protein